MPTYPKLPPGDSPNWDRLKHLIAFDKDAPDNPLYPSSFLCIEEESDLKLVELTLTLSVSHDALRRTRPCTRLDIEIAFQIRLNFDLYPLAIEDICIEDTCVQICTAIGAPFPEWESLYADLQVLYGKLLEKTKQSIAGLRERIEDSFSKIHKAVGEVREDIEALES